MATNEVPRERTETEIVERTRKADDFFGFAREVLTCHLSAEAVREFCKPDADLTDWEPMPRSCEAVMKELADYMTFAWGKVEYHRGISAERSVQKIGEYVWLLGLDGLLAEMESAEYAQYGAPKLAVVCAALDLPVPDDEGVRRMIRGERCVPDCDAGCGE